MSSNAERAPNAGAQARAEEALLKKIGQRAPSPTQAVKVCQILNLATRENIRRVREIAKNKTAFKAESKNTEGKEMRPVFQRLRGQEVTILTVGVDSFASEDHTFGVKGISHRNTKIQGKIVKAGKEYVELMAHNAQIIFVNYRQIISVSSY